MVQVANLVAIHLHLDEHPDDWVTRRMLADLLTDLGDEQGSACQRWMVELMRHPRQRKDGWHWYWTISPHSAWTRERYYHLQLGWVLPADVYDRLAGGRTYAYDDWATDTRRGAEAALCASLVAAGEI